MEEGNPSEAILIHIIRGENPGTKYWIRKPGDLNSLQISPDLVEKLRAFQSGMDELCFFRMDSLATHASEGPVVVVGERLSERRSLLVFGAGHVGQSIALLGNLLGLKVILIDDREEFLLRAVSLDSAIRTVLTDFSNFREDLQIPKHSAIVIVTRGHQSDEVILKQVADCNAGYVGMIGSRRRVAGVFRRLREQGVGDSFLTEVKAPIGLNINARTPQEIAVSVHAEMIAHFNGARFKTGREVDY